MSGDHAAENRQSIPSIDRLLGAPFLEDIIASWGRESVRAAIRTIQDRIRESETTVEIEDLEAYYRGEIERWLSTERIRGYQAVFNVTGTVLHTNLGRARIDESMFEQVKPLVTQPATIEFDLTTGRRGQREDAVCERLCRLVDADAAAIVNNNAAAVLIVLHTLACDRNVVVSRGELIEIGGSFRLPEIMEAAGCQLVEVGTTNRTHLSDYERALAKKPAMLLKVHPSNYRIQGFTKEVSTKALSELSNEHNIPCVIDLGSGALVDTQQFGLPREPLPGDVLTDGADLVTFSGDKLLGGPQAGLIVGSRELIDQINANPMKRALRTSKLTLALLDETLKAYEDVENIRDHVPTLRALSMSQKELHARAKRIHARFAEVLPEEFTIDIEETEAEVGSGAMPGHSIPSVAISVRGSTNTTTQTLFATLRGLETPVIGRMYKGAIHLDVRGAEPLEEFISNLDTLS
ncbi:MAG: L-seryl-tRNA(Sec) selenium transferase [Gammaproteobacteria bacterium]|nr:L-seryl-tRNA(Sec) selenium transferase [Gammaproteobacteria bacterium]